MDVHKLTKTELWDLIDSFGPQNKVVVGSDTVNITNQYHNVTYPIRNEQDLFQLDRIVELDSSIYRRKYNLVFCYNEGQREHFFIDPVGLKNHLTKLEKLLYKKLTLNDFGYII